MSAEFFKSKITKQNKNIYVVHDCINLASFETLERDNTFRKKLNIPQDKKIIAYIGVLYPYQGIDYLLCEFKRLIVNQKDIHLLLMGYPIDRYKRLVRKLDIKDYVTFTGRISYMEAKKYLVLADIGVSCKFITHESNGKLLLYLACGLPVIAVDTPINRELLGNAGVFIKMKKYALVNAILELINNPTEKHRLNQLARIQIKSFACENVLPVLEKVYSKILYSDG